MYGWQTTRGRKRACKLVVPPELQVVVTTRIDCAAGRKPSQPRPGEGAVPLPESQRVRLSGPTPLSDGTQVYICETCPCPMGRGAGVSFVTDACKRYIGLCCLVSDCVYGVMQRAATENWRAYPGRLGGELV